MYVNPYALLFVELGVIACCLGVAGWVIAKIIQPLPHQRCPKCKWIPRKLVFMSPDDIVAMHTERGMDKIEARTHVAQILTGRHDDECPNAGPSGLKLIFRCMKCKNFFERKL